MLPQKTKVKKFTWRYTRKKRSRKPTINLSSSKINYFFFFTEESNWSFCTNTRTFSFWKITENSPVVTEWLWRHNRHRRRESARRHEESRRKSSRQNHRRRHRHCCWGYAISAENLLKIAPQKEFYRVTVLRMSLCFRCVIIWLSKKRSGLIFLVTNNCYNISINNKYTYVSSFIFTGHILIQNMTRLHKHTK